MLPVWGRKHVAWAEFSLDMDMDRNLDPLYFKSDHSKRDAWKVVPKAIRVADQLTWELTLHHLPPMPGQIQLIDAVFRFENFTLENPIQKVANFPVGVLSVGNEWTEISKIERAGCPGEDCYVEVCYVVEKSMETECACKCGCKCGCKPQPPQVWSPLFEPPPWPSPPEPPQPVLRLAEDYRKLLLSEASSDCVFEVGDEEIRAHKLVLCARLPYFESLFASGMREASTNRVRIDDVDAASFKRVLNFLYCGQLPEDLDKCPELYLPVAEKYDAQDFKDACASALAKNLKMKNVVNTLIMAHLFRCPSLKREGIQFLSEWKDSMPGDALEPLKSYPDLVVECLRKFRKCLRYQ